MNLLCCGVDAGGSSCRAALLSADGRSKGWGYGSGANPTHAGWKQAGEAMKQSIWAACDEASVKPTQIGSVFLGMASVISAEDRAKAVALSKTWGLAPDCMARADHDIRIALHGGLATRPGIALIAGTGSSCYGRNAEGKSWQAGGWDRILDDLGSGYDLAQKGMAAACQSADGRIEHSLLQELLFGALGVTNVTDFSVKVHRPGLARHEVAALAPLVLKAAQQGDAEAEQIVSARANELSRMVEAVATRLFFALDPEVIFIGGLIEKSESYRVHVEKAIQARLPLAQFCAAKWRPAVGALALAAEQKECPLDAASLEKLSALGKE